MIISKTPFCKILTQNVLIIPLNYFFQTSPRLKSVNNKIKLIPTFERGCKKRESVVYNRYVWWGGGEDGLGSRVLPPPAKAFPKG